VSAQSTACLLLHPPPAQAHPIAPGSLACIGSTSQPANDSIEVRRDLNRELVLPLVSTEPLVVVGDAIGGVGLFNGDLVLVDRAKLPSSGRCLVLAPGQPGSMDNATQTYA
jgi:SOS-response transcriptional repressor LexA